MLEYQKAFVELALKNQALRFGQFTLKSGRVSPYFFNAGQFHTGSALARLGQCYAAAIMASGLPFDTLFGPAYKGIPLVSAVAIALSEQFGRDVPYCFNRKEAKDHGEGGTLVGAPLRGRILIIDDVITAGTAIQEVMALFDQHKEQATAAGVMIGLDRQEKGQDSNLSAAQAISQCHQLPVLSVINLDTLVTYMQLGGFTAEQLAEIEAYRASYGC